MKNGLSKDTRIFFNLLVYMICKDDETFCFTRAIDPYKYIFLQNSANNFSINLIEDFGIEISKDIFDYYSKNDVFSINIKTDKDETIAIPVIKIVSDYDILLLNLENNSLFDLNSYDKYEKKINALLDKITLLNSEITGLNEINNRLKCKISTLTEDRNQFEKKYSSLKNELKDLNDKTKFLEIKNIELDKKNEELRYVLDISVTKINSYKDKIKSLDYEINDKQKAIKEIITKGNLIKDKNKKYEIEIEDKNKKIVDLETELTELKNEMALKSKYSEILSLKIYNFNKDRYKDMTQEELIDEIEKILTENKRIKILYNDLLDNKLK